ncbi:unnamed protein product [Chrysoparadoxa australica]
MKPAHEMAIPWQHESGQQDTLEDIRVDIVGNGESSQSKAEASGPIFKPDLRPNSLFEATMDRAPPISPNTSSRPGTEADGQVRSSLLPLPPAIQNGSYIRGMRGGCPGNTYNMQRQEKRKAALPAYNERLAGIKTRAYNEAEREKARVERKLVRQEEKLALREEKRLKSFEPEPEEGIAVTPAALPVLVAAPATAAAAGGERTEAAVDKYYGTCVEHEGSSSLPPDHGAFAAAAAQMSPQAVDESQDKSQLSCFSSAAATIPPLPASISPITAADEVSAADAAHDTASSVFTSSAAAAVAAAAAGTSEVPEGGQPEN